MPEPLQLQWIKKCRKFLPKDVEEVTLDMASNLYQLKAGIFAEFAKIICISVGYLIIEKDKPISIRIKSFNGNEKVILEEFNAMLHQHYYDPKTHYLCGHNIKEFDIPFICRRSIINGVALPNLLNIAGKKPWQLEYLLDTMDMWRFGDYKNYTSIALLSAALGIPSPKDDIDGSQVGLVYWIDNDIDRITTYCEKDVVAVIQIMMKYAGLPLIKSTNIEVVPH